jgi:hypothetical protein
MTSEAVNFNKQAAQGDLYIERIDTLPANLTSIEATNGQFVVAHSETGHHHTVAAKQGVEYYASNDPLICFLVVKNDDVQLRHNRSFDTHRPIALKGGDSVYKLTRQREYTPEGWQRVAD